MDLDFVLGVISDGPAKSFAFRRLQYLRGKFTMYTLLNEFQEMTEMKVRPILLRRMLGNSLSLPAVARSSPVMQKSILLICPSERLLAISITSAKSIRTFTTPAV
jgi:hypothetical protein